MFESEIAAQLRALKQRYDYEKRTLRYTRPAKVCSYTPDFCVKGRDWLLEVKGKFDAQDRQKHLWVREQLGIEVRFVFYNAYEKIRKGSNTTYADWCEKNNFKYAHKKVPAEWFE